MAFLLALLPALYRLVMQLPLETNPVTLRVLSRVALGDTPWYDSNNIHVLSDLK